MLLNNVVRQFIKNPFILIGCFLLIGCESNDLFTLSFEYAAFSEGGMVDYKESANPEQSFLIRQHSSINAEKKAKKEDKKFIKKVMDEEKENVPPHLYREAVREFLMYDLKVASMGGPFQIVISENKDVPILGNWLSVSVKGGIFDLSGTITETKHETDFTAYHFDYEDNNLVLIVPEDFQRFPIALLFDKVTTASTIYGKSENYANEAIAFIENIVNRMDLSKKISGNVQDETIEVSEDTTNDQESFSMENSAEEQIVDEEWLEFSRNLQNEEIKNIWGNSIDANHLYSQMKENGKNLRTKIVDVDEIRCFSKAEKRILRNAIYASHGYIFNNEDLNIFFSHLGMDWYAPNYTNVDDFLTPIEQKNIHLIKSVEDFRCNSAKNIFHEYIYEFGCKENERDYCEELNVAISVNASQTLPDIEYNSYSVKNLLKNDHHIWAATFTGEPLKLVFDVSDAEEIYGLVINNGYERDRDSYLKNGRAKRISVYADNEKIGDWILNDDYGEIGNKADIIDFGKSISNVSQVVVSIDSIYEGREWNDVCITRLFIIGEKHSASKP